MPQNINDLHDFWDNILWTDGPKGECLGRFESGIELTQHFIKRLSYTKMVVVV